MRLDYYYFWQEIELSSVSELSVIITAMAVSVGELGQHDATCDFSLLPCPNKCTDQHKITTVLRKYMEKHAVECPKRTYECPHGKVTGDYQERTTKHLQECAKMENVCPN